MSAILSLKSLIQVIKDLVLFSMESALCRRENKKLALDIKNYITIGVCWSFLNKIKALLINNSSETMQFFPHISRKSKVDFYWLLI
jgi:hypothetical protein